ncbi:MAG: restriction endonuclease [archaeon]|nr:restriction endonuclease [archaeon]
MKIQKASGKTEEFSKAKFCRSLKKAGVDQALCDDVYKHIDKTVKPGVTTGELYKAAFAYLKKTDRVAASKYSLRKGIMDLGPAGFLFEQYLEAILNEYGYETQRGQMVQGECVEHEVDVLAVKENKHYMIEAKYHNTRGIKSNIQVVMYAYSRMLDIAAAHEKESPGIGHDTWVITNTKFTQKAIQYAECKGLNMTGWSYPKKGNLEELIEEKRLYPVTVLHSVNAHAREQLAAAGIVFARDLTRFEEQDLERRFRIDRSRGSKILQEARGLIGNREKN